ncbi:MAG: glycosyltransferase family 39 protein [Bacteroidia bacterium]|nr:glycosyltransferase family 39 protein [Bacteroidia bacterium]
MDRGEYSYISGDKKIYALRLPGFVPIYAPLYALFGRNTACVIMVFINFISDMLIVYLIYLICKMIFNSFNLIIFASYISALSPFISFNVHYVTTEVFSTFTVISGIYFLLRFYSDKNIYNAFFAGLFLCWSFFLRPANIIFIFTSTLFIAYVIRNKDFFKQIFYISIFLSSFLVFESLWVIRNYFQTNKIICINTHKEDFHQELITLYDLVISLGGDIQPWNKNSLVNWFLPPSGATTDENFQQSNPFEKYLFTSKYNLDSLIEYRKIFRSYYTVQSPAEKDSVLQLLKQKTKTYLNAFKEEVPWYIKFYLKTRLTLKFLFVKQVYQSPFIKLNLFNKLNKLYALIMDYLNIISFILFSLFVLKNIFNSSYNICLKYLILTSWLFILFHSFGVGYIEHRYLCNIYPVFFIASGWASSLIYNFFKRGL